MPVEAPPAPNTTVADAASEAAALGGKSTPSTFKSTTMESAFDALEKKGRPVDIEPGTIPPAPSAKKKEEAKVVPPPKPDETKKETPKPDETAPPKEETKEEVKPADTETKPVAPAKPKKPADFLREELAKVKTERDSIKSELEKVKTGQVEDPEKKTITEKLSTIEKRNKELEDHLKLISYERSNEFKEKFETPFNDAYATGRSKVSALKVTDPATGEVRPGKPEDFDAIMSLPEDQALEMIDAMFGTGARGQIVTNAREKVIEHFNARNKALEDAGKTLTERMKQHEEFVSKLNGEVSGLWEKHIKTEAIPKDHVAYCAPVEGDDEGNALLKRGYEKVDAAAKENARDPNLTPEQREGIIARAAAMRNRAAAYPRLIHWLKKRDAEIAELKESLKAFEDSEPGKGDADAGEKTQVPGGSTMDQAFANLEKRAVPKFY